MAAKRGESCSTGEWSAQGRFEEAQDGSWILDVCVVARVRQGHSRSGNFATRCYTLGVVDKSLAYRLYVLNAQHGIPYRAGVGMGRACA